MLHLHHVEMLVDKLPLKILFVAHDYFEAHGMKDGHDVPGMEDQVMEDFLHLLDNWSVWHNDRYRQHEHCNLKKIVDFRIGFC